MSETIFFCGGHCAGKTSLLKTLTKEHVLDDWAFEIGKDLFYKRKLETATQGEAFEMEVSRLELERDLRLNNSEGLIGIETWHPGNLAYATVRNPDSVPKLIELIKKSPLLEKSQGIWLRVSAEKIFERTKTFNQNRSWAAEFYTKIDRAMARCLDALGLKDKVILVNADREFDLVYADVKLAIEKFAVR